jgi:NADH dehydrogenase (ubiquinone) 1 alpha subcomplex subunit 5
MRPALRLLASVQKTKPSQYLEPGAPTGLAGLFVHATPRSTLLYVYNNTLEKLKAFPEHSVYRQSTEALTKHRLSVIEAIKPAGLEEWQTRIQKIVDSHPEAFRKIPISTPSGEKAFNVVWKPEALEGMATAEWDDEYVGKKGFIEGPAGEDVKKDMHKHLQRDLREENAKIPRIEPEPALTVDQITEIETQIQAGLLEEIIQVAEGENQLVDTLVKHSV